MSKMGQELDKRLEENKYEMLKALKEIRKGEGAFSLDHLTHAENTIESMKNTAKEVLSKIDGGE